MIILELMPRVGGLIICSLLLERLPFKLYWLVTYPVNWRIGRVVAIQYVHVLMKTGCWSFWLRLMKANEGLIQKTFTVVIVLVLWLAHCSALVTPNQPCQQTSESPKRNNYVYWKVSAYQDQSHHCWPVEFKHSRYDYQLSRHFMIETAYLHSISQPFMSLSMHTWLDMYSSLQSHLQVHHVDIIFLKYIHNSLVFIGTRPLPLNTNCPIQRVRRSSHTCIKITGI